MRKRETTDSSDLEREAGQMIRYKEPTKEDMARLQKVVGRRLANFGVLSNLGLGDYGTVAGRVFIKDLRLRIWRDIIIEEGWSAEHAQRVAAGEELTEWNEKTGDNKQGVAEVAELLATDNLLWQRWWMRDFENFRLDIGPELPSWVLTLSRQDDDKSPDAERLRRVYGSVPWRRYYAWCHFFQRRCAKLILRLADRRAENFVRDFVLPPNVPVGVLVYEPVEAIEWALHPDDPDMALYRFDDEDGRARITHFEDTVTTNESGEHFREMSLSEIALNKQPSDAFDERKGSPLLAWLLLIREHSLDVNTPEDIEQIVAELIPVRQGEMREPYPTAARRDRYLHTYTFNFDDTIASKFVVAFMAWYESRFSKRIIDDVIEEPTDRDGVSYLADRSPGFNFAQEGSYVDIDLTEDDESWPVFAELPLAPTRDGVRFIGAPMEEEEEEEEEENIGNHFSVPSASESGCLMCGAKTQSMMRERAFPDLVFCSKECHGKFRSVFPVKMPPSLAATGTRINAGVNGEEEEEGDPRFFEQLDTLYPILLRLTPTSLLAVSRASELAGVVFNDPRFRRAYVRARYRDMRNLAYQQTTAPSIMEDWFPLFLDHEETVPAVVGMLAQMATSICGREAILLEIVRHPKFAEISDTHIDGLLWVAVRTCAPTVRVLIESGFRTHLQPGAGRPSLLRQAAAVEDKPDVVAELLKSTDPYIVSPYTLVLAAYVIARLGDKAMPNGKTIFKMLLADPRFPEERKEALRRLFIGNLRQPGSARELRN